MISCKDHVVPPKRTHTFAGDELFGGFFASEGLTMQSTAESRSRALPFEATNYAAEGVALRLSEQASEYLRFFLKDGYSGYR